MKGREVPLAMSQMRWLLYLVEARQRAGEWLGLPVPHHWVIVLSSGDDTEVNGMGRVEEGIGF